MKLTKKVIPKMEIQIPEFKPQNSVTYNSNTKKEAYKKVNKPSNTFNYELQIDSSHIQQLLTNIQKKPPSYYESDESFCCIY